MNRTVLPWLCLISSLALQMFPACSWSEKPHNGEIIAVQASQSPSSPTSAATPSSSVELLSIHKKLSIPQAQILARDPKARELQVRIAEIKKQHLELISRMLREKGGASAAAVELKETLENQVESARGELRNRQEKLNRMSKIRAGKTPIPKVDALDVSAESVAATLSEIEALKNDLDRLTKDLKKAKQNFNRYAFLLTRNPTARELEASYLKLEKELHEVVDQQLRALGPEYAKLVDRRRAILEIGKR